MRSLTFTLLCFSAVAAPGCVPSGTEREDSSEKSRRAAIEAIKACRGKDLRSLEPDRIRELLGHMSELGLERAYQDWIDLYGPLHVWDFRNEKGQLLLFEADKISPHPGRTRITLTVLNDSGKVVSETDLTTGWRCYLRDAKLQAAAGGGYPLVVLETGLGSGPGPNVGEQYYAWIGQRFELVRLEDSDGKATRNRYHINHFRCGPTVPELTEAEWVADLASPDRLRVLRALVWLGGVHWDLQSDEDFNRRYEGFNQKQFEDFDQVRLVRKVRANEKVIARLEDLAKGDDRWLREAALLAANPEDDRIFIP
ncbi:MAG TPA: hypothetical protein VIL46_05090 [Gemmataceae bacterium]